MPRRVALPGAQELFRATEPAADQGLRHSGRVKHDEKITVYVSAEELLALEQARLTLRARHGIAVDRGRIVRAAVALAVADLDANGDECDLIRQLDAS
ncbi:MAG: hypothetical protein QM619_09115 [Micropruina sp.]|uniref:hypothetical protein n=1 Tax=Micropruina sp. TaxID=2737536 RepID=UPI0039E57CC0